MSHPDPQKLAQHLRHTAALLEDHGAAMLQRAHDWTLPPRQGEGHQWTRGGGLADPDAPQDDERTNDSKEEQRVSRLHADAPAVAGVRGSHTSSVIPMPNRRFRGWSHMTDPRGDLVAALEPFAYAQNPAEDLADAVLAAGWVHSSQLEQVGWWCEDDAVPLRYMTADAGSMADLGGEPVFVLRAAVGGVSGDAPASVPVEDP